MLSDYDKANAAEIITDKRADWFSAILMRHISSMVSIDERIGWSRQFPDAVKAVQGLYTPPGLAPGLMAVCWKADAGNKSKIASVLRELADRLDPPYHPLPQQQR